MAAPSSKNASLDTPYADRYPIRRLDSNAKANRPIVVAVMQILKRERLIEHARERVSGHIASRRWS